MAQLGVLKSHTERAHALRFECAQNRKEEYLQSSSIVGVPALLTQVVFREEIRQ